MEKPLKKAAWAGIISIILAVAFVIVMIPFSFLGSNFVQVAQIIYQIIILLLGVIFIFGFIVLGKKFKNKFLVVMAWIGIIFAIVFTLISLFYNPFQPDFLTEENLLKLNASLASSFQNLENLENLDGLENFDPDNPEMVFDALELDPFAKEFLTQMIVYFLVVYLVIAIGFGLYSILFGVALLKISKKVDYAKPAAILNIVAGATYFIFAGFLIKLVAFVFEIIMFFAASKKFEK